MRANVLSSPWLRPFNDPATWQAIARCFNPDYRTGGYRVRVVDVIDETINTKTFVLQSNRHWLGSRWRVHKAGQHIQLSLTIDGRTLHRTFSISSAPSDDGCFAITVKRHAASRRKHSVTAWMFDHLNIGDRLDISPAQGDFIFNNHEDNSAFMISAGSGITPLMAMLRTRAQAAEGAAIVFIHVCKNRAELIFAQELQALAAHAPWLQLHLHFSDSQSGMGRFDLATCLARYPELTTAPLYLCGPSAFARAIEEQLRQAGRTNLIAQESFGGIAYDSTSVSDECHEIQLTHTKQTFTAPAKQLLLEALESVGLNPAFGCRIGICKSCQCLKRSGVVQNQRTGETSDAPNELIQLCVSTARSPLVIAL